MGDPSSNKSISLIKNNILSKTECLEISKNIKKNTDLVFDYFFLTRLSISKSRLLTPIKYINKTKIKRLRRIRFNSFGRIHKSFAPYHYCHTISIMTLSDNICSESTILIKQFMPPIYNIGDIIMINKKAHSYVLDVDNDDTTSYSNITIKQFDDQQIIKINPFSLELMKYHILLDRKK